MQVQGFSTYSNYNSQMQARTPVFRGYTSRFGKTLHSAIDRGYPTEVEKKSLLGEIQKFIREKLSPDRLLGEGAHGSVYKIDDDFCMKFDIGTKPRAKKMGELPENGFKGLKTYYGSKVADFDDVAILKNVSPDGEHIPVGVPQKFAINNSSDENFVYYQCIALPRLSDLPQKSFDAVAEDCQRLNELGAKNKTHYTFDYINPNNFVIVNDKIRIIDDINVLKSSEDNSVANLFNVFLEKSFLNTPVQYSLYSETTRKKLFKKIVLAGMKAGLPMRSKHSTENLSSWKNVVNELCGMDNPYGEVLHNLEKISQNPNKEQRVKLANDYLDYLFEYDKFQD